MQLSLFRMAAALFAGLAAAPAMAAEPGSPEQKLAAAGFKLPSPDVPEGNYASAVRAGNLLFFAGHGECSRTGPLGSRPCRKNAHSVRSS